MMSVNNKNLTNLTGRRPLQMDVMFIVVLHLTKPLPNMIYLAGRVVGICCCGLSLSAEPCQYVNGRIIIIASDRR